MSTSGITIGDTSSYNFTGNAITLGAGGISASSSGTSLSATFGMPIALAADQTWSLIGGEDLSFSGNITGSHTLSIGVSGGSIASLSGVEVGTLTLSGTSSNSVFELSGPSYNGTDGSPVSLEGRALAEANFTTGPLTLTSGTLDLGTSSPETVTVNGALSTVSASKIVPVVDTSASSLLSASGNVSLGGDLGFQGAGFTCLTLTPGQSYTLIQTTGGTLSGAFANAPEGAVLPVPCAPNPDGYLRIHYASTAVTATVVAVPSLSMSAPSSGTAGGPISASLSGGASPSGTVTFKVFGPQASAPSDCSTGGTTV
ncbi:MAG: hypothetical protein ACJ764_06205, partial [Solirubrobacteraceae bacterium]